MKKPYHIAAGRALQRMRQWAEERNPTVQLVLPMVEILALAKRSAGELVREAGLRVILLAIQQEADALTGTRHQHGPDRQALRWSREDGFVVVDGPDAIPLPRERGHDLLVALPDEVPVDRRDADDVATEEPHAPRHSIPTSRRSMSTPHRTSASITTTGPESQSRAAQSERMAPSR